MSIAIQHPRVTDVRQQVTNLLLKVNEANNDRKPQTDAGSNRKQLVLFLLEADAFIDEVSTMTPKERIAVLGELNNRVKGGDIAISPNAAKELNRFSREIGARQRIRANY
jgi:hypothetical protein